jgi:hypothetical protein
MSKTRIRGSAYVVDSENITDSKEIRVMLTTHLLDDEGWSVGILTDHNYKISIEEAKEFVEYLEKAIAEAKANERERFEQAVERVNSL